MGPVYCMWVTKDSRNSFDYNFRCGMINPFGQERITQETHLLLVCTN